MNVGAQTQTTATSTQTVTTPLDHSTALVQRASVEMELYAKVCIVKKTEFVLFCLITI